MTFSHSLVHKILLIFSLLSFAARAEDPELSVDGNPVTHKRSAWIISPLFGWIENQSRTTGDSDISPEYGLFAMYATPRLLINNTTFFSDVRQNEVWGNITSVNLYGNPRAKVTWYLGASYVWHQIQNDTVNVRINEPLGKVGVLWRIQPLHLSLSPYVGYGCVDVRTKVSTPVGTRTFRDRSDVVVCGLSAYWRWRMLHANAKYYLSKDLDHDTLNHHVRIWGTAMFTKRLGGIVRLEYGEQNATQDTSLLMGPVFVF